MSAIAALTLNDGQSTPVAHTFNPEGVLNQMPPVALYADRSTGVAVGFPRLSISLSTPPVARRGQASTADRVYRAKMKVMLPVLETLGTNDAGVTPPATKAFDLVFNGEFILPERSSLQNRKDILAYAKNLLTQAVITALVQDLEAVY